MKKGCLIGIGKLSILLETNDKKVNFEEIPLEGWKFKGEFYKIIDLIRTN